MIGAGAPTLGPIEQRGQRGEGQQRAGDRRRRRASCALAVQRAVRVSTPVGDGLEHVVEGELGQAGGTGAQVQHVAVAQLAGGHGGRRVERGLAGCVAAPSRPRPRPGRPPRGRARTTTIDSSSATEICTGTARSTRSVGEMIVSRQVFVTTLADKAAPSSSASVRRRPLRIAGGGAGRSVGSCVAGTWSPHGNGGRVVGTALFRRPAAPQRPARTARRDRARVPARAARDRQRRRRRADADLPADGRRRRRDRPAGDRHRREADHLPGQRDDGPVDGRHGLQRHGPPVGGEAAPPRRRPARLPALPRAGPAPGAQRGRAAAGVRAVAPPRPGRAVVHRARHPAVGAAPGRRGLPRRPGRSRVRGGWR